MLLADLLKTDREIFGGNCSISEEPNRLEFVSSLNKLRNRRAEVGVERIIERQITQRDAQPILAVTTTKQALSLSQGLTSRSIIAGTAVRIREQQRSPATKRIPLQLSETCGSLRRKLSRYRIRATPQSCIREQERNLSLVVGSELERLQLIRGMLRTVRRLSQETFRGATAKLERRNRLRQMVCSKLQLAQTLRQVHSLQRRIIQRRGRERTAQRTSRPLVVVRLELKIAGKISKRGWRELTFGQS